MKAHPIAALFPMMSDAELQELAADIKRHGLCEPIVVDDEEWLKAHPKPTARGRNGHLKVREWNKAYEQAIDDGEILIVDGRNRYMACKLAGIGYHGDDVTIEYRTLFSWDGESDPIAFIVSKNIHRRQLSVSQRSMVIAGIGKWRKGNNQHTEISGSTQEEAAAAEGVSADSLGFAKKVHDHGVPELKQAVIDDRVAVSTAAVIATEPEEKQREIVAKGEAEILEAAKQIRKAKRAAKPKPSATAPTGPDVEAWTRKGVAEGFCDAETAERIVERTKAKATPKTVDEQAELAATATEPAPDEEDKGEPLPEHVAKELVAAEADLIGRIRSTVDHWSAQHRLFFATKLDAMNKRIVSEIMGGVMLDVVPERVREHFAKQDAEAVTAATADDVVDAEGDKPDADEPKTAQPSEKPKDPKACRACLPHLAQDLDARQRSSYCGLCWQAKQDRKAKATAAAKGDEQAPQQST